MRILWVGHFVPWPLRSGLIIRSYHLIREIARHNEVSFLGFNQKALLRTREGLADAERAIAAHCLRVRVLPIPREGLPLTRERVTLRSLVSRSYDEVWLDSSRMREAVGGELARFDPQLVHLDTVGLAQYASEVRSAPVVLNHHNIESHMMRRRAGAQRNPLLRAVLSIQAKRLEAAEKAAAPRCRLQLAVSELDRDRLLASVPGTRVAVIPNGVDLDYFRTERRMWGGRSPSLLFVGSMAWHPNRSAVEWFLEQVFPILLAECPGVTFTVVGRHPSPRILAKVRGVPGVVCPGEVEDIRPWVARSTVFVCPMHEGGGTRLKVLDAMAQGIPLVATSMAVEGIGIQPGVHALVADSPSGFAEAVIRLLRDESLQRSLSEEARRLVTREYAWEKIGRRLHEAYESVLRRAA